MDNTNAKISHTQKCMMKTDFFQKIVFFLNENPSAQTFLITVQKITTALWVQRYLSNPTIWKPKAQAFQNSLTFAQYLFNSGSNMCVNLVHWNSLHSKKAIHHIFLVKVTKPELTTYMIRKFGPLRSFWA